MHVEFEHADPGLGSFCRWFWVGSGHGLSGLPGSPSKPRAHHIQHNENEDQMTIMNLPEQSVLDMCIHLYDSIDIYIYY